MGGGSPSTQTTHSTSEPWEVQQPLLQQGFESAQNLHENYRPEYYPGQTYVDPSQNTLAAIDHRVEAAQQGNFGAGNLVQDTIRGDYLGGDQFQRAYGDNIMDRVNSQFGRSGGGSAYHAGEAAERMGTVAARLYDSERNRQMGAVNQVPTLLNADYDAADQLAAAGAAQEGIAAMPLQEDINRFEFNQGLEEDALAKFMAMIQGNYGSVGSQTKPIYGPSKGQGAMAGALSGAGIGASVSGPAAPMGALIGGLIGAAGGYATS